MTEKLVVDYAVLGFSISGVAAALELSRRGASVCIIEYYRDTVSFPGMYYVFQTPLNSCILRGFEFEDIVIKNLKENGIHLLFNRFLVEKINLCSDENCFELCDDSKVNIQASYVIFSPNGTEIGCEINLNNFYGFGVSNDAYSDRGFFCGKNAIVVGCGDRAAEQALWAAESASEVMIMCNKTFHEINYKWLGFIEEKSIIHVCCDERLESLISDSEGNLKGAVFVNKYGRYLHNVSVLYQALGYYCDFSVWGGRDRFDYFMKMGRICLSGLAIGINSTDHNLHFENGIQTAGLMLKQTKRDYQGQDYK